MSENHTGTKKLAENTRKFAKNRVETELELPRKTEKDSFKSPDRLYNKK